MLPSSAFLTDALIALRAGDRVTVDGEGRYHSHDLFEELEEPT